MTGDYSRLSEEGGNGQGAEERIKVPRYMIYLVYLTLFLDTVSSSISGPVLPFLAKRLDADDFGVGLLYTVPAFFGMLAVQPMAYFSDNKFGRKAIMWVSLLGAGLAALIQGCATNYWQLLAGRAIGGIWASVGMTACAYIMDVCPEVGPDRAKVWLNKESALKQFANVIGPGIGGTLSLFGLQFPLLMDAGVNVVAAAVVFILLKEPEELKKAENKGDKTTSTDKSIAIPMIINVIGLTSFFNNIAKGTVSSMYAVFGSAWFGLDAFYIGQADLVCAAMEILSVLFAVQQVIDHITNADQSGEDVKKREHKALLKVNVFGTIIVALGLGAVVFAPNAYLYIASKIFMRCGQSFRNATGSSMKTGYMSQNNKAAVMARQKIFGQAGQLVGPVTMGYLAVNSYKILVWPIASCMSWVSAVVFFYIWQTA